MGFMDFNDQAGQINNNPGQYRVMQVVLREKFVEKVLRTSKKSKIFVTNSLHRAIAYIPSPSPLLLLLASVAATVRFVIWCLRKCTKRAFLLMLIKGRFNK